MLSLSVLLLLPLVAAATDTTLVIGRMERDLTGDGKPEVLTLVGTGKTIDSLDVTLSIESLGETVYRTTIGPLTRRVGFDGDRRMRTPTEQRRWLAEFPGWFFHKDKFLRPADFIAAWRRNGPAHADEFAEVIARDGGFYPDTLRAMKIWAEIQRSGATIFEFSPGGDTVMAIAWSVRDSRFYRLVECC
jgi:hypothetical protein